MNYPTAFKIPDIRKIIQSLRNLFRHYYLRNIQIILGMIISCFLLGCSNNENKNIIWLVKPNFDSIKDFSEGLAWVKYSDIWGIINNKGEFVLFPDNSYFEVCNFHYGLSQVKTKLKWYGPVGIITRIGKWGFISKLGQTVIEPQFDSVGDENRSESFFSDGRHESYGEYDSDFNEGFIRVMKEHKWGFVDKNGQIVIEPQYVNAGDFSEGLARVKRDENWFYVDEKGQLICSGNFEEAQDFQDGLARVKINGLWGLIDKNNKIITMPQFEGIGPFREGLALILKNGKVGYVNTKG